MAKTVDPALYRNRKPATEGAAEATAGQTFERSRRLWRRRDYEGRPGPGIPLPLHPLAPSRELHLFFVKSGLFQAQNAVGEHGGSHRRLVDAWRRRVAGKSAEWDHGGKRQNRYPLSQADQAARRLETWRAPVKIKKYARMTAIPFRGRGRHDHDSRRMGWLPRRCRPVTRSR